MKKMHAVSVLFCLFILAALVSCSAPPAAEPQQAPPAAAEPIKAEVAADHPGKALFESRCSTCHGLNMTETSKKDHKGWEATVERMVLAGAQLNEDQAKQVADYLAQTYPK
jgi:mono/diheme cytochrome c family protein